MTTLNQITDALSAPIGELIAAVGNGVAEAQQAMDEATIAKMRALAHAEDSDTLHLLRQMGWQPTWYQIPEVEAQLNVALSVSGSETQAGKIRLLAAPVDASYQSRFNYQLQVASTVKFRIVPVPPSPKAERARAVPILTGLSFKDAKARLVDTDIAWQLVNPESTPAEDAKVSTQYPAPGTLIDLSAAVQIGF